MLVDVKIRVMPFLQKKGNRVAKGALQFTAPKGAKPEEIAIAGFTMVGFTICDDTEKGLFVLFPSSIVKRGEDTKPYFFLRPDEDGLLDKLQNAILDVYESMIGDNQGFNTPRLASAEKQ